MRISKMWYQVMFFGELRNNQRMVYVVSVAWTTISCLVRSAQKYTASERFRNTPKCMERLQFVSFILYISKNDGERYLYVLDIRRIVVLEFFRFLQLWLECCRDSRLDDAEAFRLEYFGQTERCQIFRFRWENQTNNIFWVITTCNVSKKMRW